VCGGRVVGWWVGFYELGLGVMEGRSSSYGIWMSFCARRFVVQ